MVIFVSYTKKIKQAIQIMLMWSHLTWGFIGREWRGKQKDKDWVTVERFRRAQASFIHSQPVSISILLFIMQGKMLCLCCWFFSFRLFVSQSIKAVPFWPGAPVTSDVFQFIQSFWSTNPIPTPPLPSLLPPRDEQAFATAFGWATGDRRDQDSEVGLS